ncbi:eukaryotic translation initiation factor 2-alpha kinase 1 isoform X2 [Calliopsis andreniformis]
MKLIDSSYNMMEFEAVRGQYQRALYHLVTVARAATGCESALQIPNSLVTEWSRYRRDFQEISFIGGGGFGNVFKALHRLDGIEYAVKKIVVRSGHVKSIMQHLEEVKTLARLNHTNIVSYKGAWIEPTLPLSIIPSLPSTSGIQNQANSTYCKVKEKYKTCVSQNINAQSQSSCSSSSSGQNPNGNEECNKNTKFKHGKRIVEENVSETIEKTNSNSISFRSDSNQQQQVTENSTNYTSSDSVEESESNKKVCPYVPRMKEQYATLYIQMALCDMTLQQWLDDRIEVPPQGIIIRILTQILDGLDYIHSCGIVHHDIKPSNIFISTSRNLQIQLGDFGLACPLQREDHHSILGTQMYAAPEQLQGKCDPKSDIYSLGIVLLELLVHTKTNMERVEIIRSVKRGQIPTSLAAAFPKWAHIVSQLVQVDAKKRPSTRQLLQNLNEDKDMMIAQLRNDIAERDDRIQKLQDRIFMLEAQMNKYNIPLEDT